LSEELHTSGVSVQVGEAVQAIVYDTKSQSFTITTKENTYSARACIVATGGTARPDTGATGEGFAWIKGMGHLVFPNSTALVPLALVPDWTKALSGLTLSSVSVSVWAYDKKQMAASGRLLFTHFGVTGPLILNMSAYVGEFLEHTPVTLRLDVFPQYDAGALKAYFKTLLASNKKLVNTLAIVLPRKLVQGVLQELQISGETPCHSVSTQDRKQLRTYLKAIPLPVAGLLGPDKAVISSGGVKLEEIDFKTMQSKIIPGLYLIGDMLHINRPSGGYSLQLCWSTGYVAGSSAAKI
jgi:predicted Rossmann fold flavoprotein